MQLVYWCS